MKEVVYCRTREDAMAFLWYHFTHQRAVQLLILVVAMLIGALLVQFRVEPGPIRTLLLSFSLTFAFILFLVFFVFRKLWLRLRVYLMLYQEKDAEKFFAETRLVISPETVEFSTKFGTELLRWRAIERIVVTDEGAYMFVTSVFAFIVPRRAFLLDQDYRDFFDTAIQYHRHASEQDRIGPAS